MLLIALVLFTLNFLLYCLILYSSYFNLVIKSFHFTHNCISILLKTGKHKEAERLYILVLNKWYLTVQINTLLIQLYLMFFAHCFWNVLDWSHFECRWDVQRLCLALLLDLIMSFTLGFFVTIKDFLSKVLLSSRMWQLRYITLNYVVDVGSYEYFSDIVTTP